ncbi:hypothetical protein ACGFNX_20095 [Streptomyces sp. NPDC048723]|uniref:hypothetical protein n=1 Tax=Streptomyces sp. NPDC048723 TaxID=3365589 RepID=UPI003715A8F4
MSCRFDPKLAAEQDIANIDWRRDPRDAFERDLRQAITEFDPDDAFDEVVRTEVIIVTRPSPCCLATPHHAAKQWVSLETLPRWNRLTDCITA